MEETRTIDFEAKESAMTSHAAYTEVPEASAA
jgi:hypothetical protein